MAGREERGPLLVVSDLDGCLLDEAYSYDPARPALAALERAGVPLVLASSKTRGEMEALVRVLGLDTPFIVENGGAILLPAAHLPRAPGAPRPDDPYVTVPLGTSRRVLVEALKEIAAQAGVRVMGFASLTPRELERLTGLSAAAAEHALRRAFDEPFLIEGGPDSVSAVTRVAFRRGLQVTRGGRFHHLSGPTDKGEALRRLLSIYAGQGHVYHTVGLGDAANDLGLLQSVERPIIVPRPDGTAEAVLTKALPRAERAPAPGPRGWNEAVLAVLRGDRLAVA